MKTKKLIARYEQENKDLFLKIKCKENSMRDKSHMLFLIKRNRKLIEYLERKVLFEDLKTSFRNMFLFFLLAGLAHIVSLFYYVLFK